MPAPVNYHKGTNSINALVATPNGYNFAPAGLSNPNTNPITTAFLLQTHML
jgi:hypothetical protein